MVFSDSTNKNGLVQRFEFWTRLSDGEVTGTLLKQVTALFNEGLNRVMPLLLSYSDFIRWDDTNHTDAPIGYITITSGQPDYKLGEDDNSLDILNLTKVRVLPSTTATVYQELERMTLDDERVAEAMSPSITGVPTHFIENGANLYLYPNPNYTKALGIELFFGREPSYFASTDTTKEAGIPKIFHELLVLYASQDYVSVFRPSDTNTLTIIQDKITKIERDLKNFIDLRNPTRVRMTFNDIYPRR
jgi:hypothetical protein